MLQSVLHDGYNFHVISYSYVSYPPSVLFVFLFRANQWRDLHKKFVSLLIVKTLS